MYVSIYQGDANISPTSCTPETTSISVQASRLLDRRIQQWTCTSCRGLTWFFCLIITGTSLVFSACLTDSDHFDQHVEASLRRNLPIITTSHAKDILTSKGPDSFTSIFDLEPFEQMLVNISSESNYPSMLVTGMPGKHVPVVKPVEKLNELVGAVRCLFLFKLTVHFANGIGPPHQRLDAGTRLRHHRRGLHHGLQDLHIRRHAHGRRPKGDPKVVRRA